MTESEGRFSIADLTASSFTFLRIFSISSGFSNRALSNASNFAFSISDAASFLLSSN